MDLTKLERQCWSFLRRRYGGIHGGVRRQNITESVNGVDETSPRVHGAPSFMLLLHHLHDQNARRRFT